MSPRAKTHTEPASGRGQDVVRAMPREGALVLVVADGAGGMGGGREAAEAIVAAVESVLDRLVGSDADDVAAFLRELDARIAAERDAGETTAVVAVVRPGEIVGASVGDSEAWVCGASDDPSRLTAAQQRKPLLGSGAATPVAFTADALAAGDTLLLATDGLTKYAAPERIVTVARRREGAGGVLAALVDLVRLRSGALQDDVGIVLCRDDGVEA